MLKKGCRLKDETLLIPEGIVRLNPVGKKIIQLCDGEHTISEIIDCLQKLYASQPGTESTIEKDIQDFLIRMAHKGYLEGVT